MGIESCKIVRIIMGKRMMLERRLVYIGDVVELF